MRLIDRLHERRERLRSRVDRGEKGSIWFWFQLLTIAIEILKLWRTK